MKRIALFTSALFLLTTAFIAGQAQQQTQPPQGQQPQGQRQGGRGEEMTWMDVRDAMKAGKTTMIITTGGIEPNGPWLALGKHNYVLRANCDAIARKLGNALCAPILPWVAQGPHAPKSTNKF